jgi:hypothetical protein
MSLLQDKVAGYQARPAMLRDLAVVCPAPQIITIPPLSVVHQFGGRWQFFDIVLECGSGITQYVLDA